MCAGGCAIPRSSRTSSSATTATASCASATWGARELGAQTYDNYSRVNGQNAANIGIFDLPEANALDVARGVRARMDELKTSFPPGLEYTIPYDTTTFVQASLAEVKKTLLVAAVLVFLVIFLFLQNWRATLIPAITIPVSLIGAFAGMAALGFSINILTLFGLVLAIGIVVDDAIVVVENVWHHMEKEGATPRAATITAMEEITGPIIAITLVLMCVFVPTSLFPGITGQLYRQFAATIALSTGLSAINALTLTPALCAIFLRPSEAAPLLLFRAFNWAFSRTARASDSLAHGLVRRAGLAMMLYFLMSGVAGWKFHHLPTGFIPTEDQGRFLGAAQLPDAATLERTRAVTDRMEGFIRQTPGVRYMVTLGGQSLGDGSAGTNIATINRPWRRGTSAQTRSCSASQGPLRARV